MFQEYVKEIIRQGEYAENAKVQLFELLEEYGFSDKEINGLILRARIEGTLEENGVRAFCESELARKEKDR